jgi:hypothetical protein
MLGLGGHLGSSVSALVDGQLDPKSAERAWDHVMRCASCRRLVTREGWVKRRLAQMGDAGPPPELLGSLVGMAPDVTADAPESWRAVAEIEQQGRGRRRAGLAAAGVGSVSAAVLGLTTLGGVPLDIGGAGGGTPAPSASLSGSPQPTAATRAPTVRQGPFAGWSTRASQTPSPSTFLGVPVRSAR